MICRYCHISGVPLDILRHEKTIHRTEMYNLLTKTFDERFKDNEYYKNN